MMRFGSNTPCHTVAILPTMVAPTSTRTNEPCSEEKDADHARVARNKVRYACKGGQMPLRERILQKHL